jgi:hypothetical protein
LGGYATSVADGGRGASCKKRQVPSSWEAWHEKDESSSSCVDEALGTPQAIEFSTVSISALVVAGTARSRSHDTGVFQIEFRILRSETLFSQPATDPGTICTGIGCWLIGTCLGSRNSEFELENSSVMSAGTSGICSIKTHNTENF